jgi:hypothetical protein
MCNKKKILLICTKTKSIENIRNNEMLLRSKKKFQLFLKQEILIHANIEQLIFISLKFESTFGVNNLASMQLIVTGPFALRPRSCKWLEF